ncbi:MAG TPA: 5-dehydro-2-deoxygluconokinase [Dongiaceae bacterium]|jgi:5-dehydro-2-deoxygluconokinase|nr:5-dehydro-2-deoxygluconokinase [Dongiaceae bacterium]
MALDLITIGRCSVDLYGQQIGGRLEDMASFAKYVGGCPANIAIGTARLGLSSAFLSRVGDEHMGRFIQETMAAEGVDISHLRTDPHRLTALVILGIRDQHRFPLIFYRENCADLAIDESDVDADFISSARAVLVTGTHFSTPGIDRASRRAISLARQAGRTVILDIDYRPVLWGLTGHGLGEERFVADKNVTQHLQSILPDCDIVVGTEEEFHIAAGTSDTDKALRVARSLTEAVLVCKRGPLGCTIYPGAIEDAIEVGGNRVDVFNVLGAGDAFMSGLLYGHLSGHSWEQAGRFANACGALVVSRHGCAPAMPDKAELDYYLANGSNRYRLREDETLNHYHWAANRPKALPHVFALAIDHRAQFADMAHSLGAPAEKIARFKSCAVQAARRVAAGRPGFGMLLDDTYGREALFAASEGDLWLARPVERPGSRPLEFENGRDIAATLLDWPRHHVVKCLVFYRPDDPRELREKQEETLLTLQEATRATGHELLIEIIASKHGSLYPSITAESLERLYKIGLKPDWWKLEPHDDPADWQAIARIIATHDPLCRGIVILGLEAPEEALAASFAVAKKNAPVKGFAVGRTIFAQAAERYLRGESNEEAAIDDMARRFGRLVKAWEEI